MVVVTLSGVPRVGGSVTWGRTGCILAVTKTSLTRDVIIELLPTPSSPQTQIRTLQGQRGQHPGREGALRTGSHVASASLAGRREVVEDSPMPLPNAFQSVDAMAEFARWFDLICSPGALRCVSLGTRGKAAGSLARPTGWLAAGTVNWC